MNIWCFLNIFGRRIDLKFYTSLWKWDLCSCILLVKLVFWTDGLTMATLLLRHLIQNGIFIFTFFVTNRNKPQDFGNQNLYCLDLIFLCTHLRYFSPIRNIFLPYFWKHWYLKFERHFWEKVESPISDFIPYWILSLEDIFEESTWSLTLSTSLVAKTAKYCRSSNRHLEEKLRQKTFCGQTCECTPDTIGRRGPEGGK